MRTLLINLALAIPSFVVGITAGEIAASLGAPAPLPLFTALVAAVAAIGGLDHLVGNLLAHRAARRD